jgi:hypothetical protein
MLPEDNNIGVNGTGLPFNYANAHRQRSDCSMSLHWLPTNTDIHFAYPTDLVDTEFAANVVNNRAQIQIENADTVLDYDLMVEFVVFYEIGGQCVMETGNFSDCMPQMGAQIFNGIKSYAFDNMKEPTQARRPTELGAAGTIHPRQDKIPLGKHLTAQMIKGIPKLEALADAQVLAKPATKKGFFSRLWDGAKSALPTILSIAGTLL